MKQPNIPNFASFLNKQDANSSKTPRKSTQIIEYKSIQSLLKKPFNNKKNVQNRDTNYEYFQQRIQNSPLKVPLKKAIEKAVKNMNKQNDLGYSRKLPKNNVSRKYSNLEDQSMYIIKQNQYPIQDIDQILKSMHPQTHNFLKDHFQDYNFDRIDIDRFIESIIMQYKSLWQHQQAELILSEFKNKLKNLLGNPYLDIKLLQMLTKQIGLIGLILRIFKQIQRQQGNRSETNITYYPYNNIMKQSFEERLNSNSDVQNIKNIIQQFIQTMYRCMNNQIYNKFQIDMRRMVLCFKETQKMLKIVNDKITHNYDIFSQERKKQEKIRSYEIQIQQLRQSCQKSQILLEKQKLFSKNLKFQNQKLTNQIKRLNQNLQKFQNAILYKQNQIDPSISRNTSHQYIQPNFSRKISQANLFSQKQNNLYVNEYHSNSPINTTYNNLDISNTSAYKTTSILTPSIPMNGNIKVNINTQVFHKEPMNCYSNFNLNQIDKSVSGYQTQRENVRVENYNTTPPKITITRIVQPSPLKQRVLNL